MGEHQALMFSAALNLRQAVCPLAEADYLCLVWRFMKNVLTMHGEDKG
jgi:hypothetical protein